MVDKLKGTNQMETLDGHSWFLIECSWDCEADVDAMSKWVDVYNWFKDTSDQAEAAGSLRNEIADEGLLALNLIAKRRFVIACQAQSNRPLQQVASMITLKTAIKVDVFAATNVFEFGNINQDRLGFDIGSPTGQIKSTR